MKKVFPNNGEDFSGWVAALAWCQENDYSHGPMQAGAPTGIAKGDVGIEKWRNIPRNQYHLLDGKIEGDYRYGTVTITIGKVD